MKKLTMQLVRMIFPVSCLIFLEAGASGEIKSTGESESSYTGCLVWNDETDRVIKDKKTQLIIWQPTEELPPNAIVTNVQVSVLIDDNGNPANFRCVDYEIYVGTSSKEICIYDNRGGDNDEGHDDDYPSDSDIDLYCRNLHDFDGESAKQSYTWRIVDNMDGCEGKVKYVRMTIFWEAPSPNLDANYKPAAWSAPIVAHHNSVGPVHVDPENLYAGLATYFSSCVYNWDYAIPNDYEVNYKLWADGTLISSGHTSGFNANYLHEIYIADGKTFTAGEHRFCHEVDTDNNIWWESDESDNRYCRTLTFIGPPVSPALSLPSNGLTCQATEITLKWSTSAYAVSFNVQLDNNSDFSSPLVNVTTTGTSRPVTGLSKNTKYYWRVRGINPAGIGSFSATRSFTTVPDASAIPSLASPDNGSGCRPTSLTLDWGNASNASTYSLQVDNNSDFSSPVISQAGITASEYAVSGLSSSTTYYWRVASANSCKTSAWSSVRNFTTAEIPSVPSLSSPSSGADCQSTSLTLTWNSVSGATAYDLRVDNNSDFSSPESNQTDIASTSASVSGLSTGTPYYWVVRAKNSCGVTSSWSDARSFTTAASSTSAPSSVTPSDGAGCQPLSVTLIWGSASGASSYTLQVDNNNDFGSPVFNQAGIASESQSVSGLDEGATFYWRVKAANSCGTESSWSPVSSFTTLITSLGQPVLEAPADDIQCQPVDPTLSWSSVPDATGYSVEIDDNDDFSSPEYSQDCAGTMHNCTGLSSNTRYYWRICARTPCDVTGPWSDAHSFETNSGTIAAPSLATPDNYSIEQPITLTLQWNAVADAIRYRFQLDVNDDFTSPLYNEELTDNTIQVSELTGDTTYYWHIRAGGECAESDWSETWQFRTKADINGLTASEDNGYRLEQNFPNPFTGLTVIGFSIPADDHVSIEFFDLQGRIVESYSGYYSAGKHTIEISFSQKVQAGVYLYRMRIGDFTDTRYCILR